MSAPHGLALAAGDDRAVEAFLVYAGPGVGKTTGAVSTAPGRVLLLNAESRGATKYGRRVAASRGVEVDELPIAGKESFREALLALRADAGATWSTVVLDPVPEAYRILVDEACGGSGMPQVQHYGEGGKVLERFCREVVRMGTVHVVLVAHEEIVDGPDGALLMPMCGGNKLPGILCGMVDHVGYVGVVHDEGGTEPRRVVQFAPGRNRYAKNRGGALGAVAPFDVAGWVDVIAQADAGADSHEVN